MASKKSTKKNPRLALLVDGKPGAKLTPEQEQAVVRAALAVWNEIGGDCLRAREECGLKPVMPRAEVVEVVMDADRLTEHLRRTAPAAHQAYVDLGFNRQDAVVRKAFPCARYGW